MQIGGFYYNDGFKPYEVQYKTTLFILDSFIYFRSTMVNGPVLMSSIGQTFFHSLLHTEVLGELRGTLSSGQTRKHCCGNKFRPNSTETMFPSMPTCLQMFPARETLFSRLDMLKQCFKTIVQI